MVLGKISAQLAAYAAEHDMDEAVKRGVRLAMRHEDVVRACVAYCVRDYLMCASVRAGRCKDSEAEAPSRRQLWTCAITAAARPLVRGETAPPNPAFMQGIVQEAWSMLDYGIDAARRAKDLRPSELIAVGERWITSGKTELLRGYWAKAAGLACPDETRTVGAQLTREQANAIAERVIRGVPEPDLARLALKGEAAA